MEQALLLLHLALVVFLIALVLLQRSEGGALGIGGGGGGVVSGRGAATALQKATWYLAAGFLATSLTLTVLAQSDRAGSSVLDSVDLPVDENTLGGSTDGAIGSALDALSVPNDDGLTPPTDGGGAAAPAASGDDVTPPAE